MQTQTLQQIARGTEGEPEIISATGQHRLPGGNAVVVDSDQHGQCTETGTQFKDPCSLIAGQDHCDRSRFSASRHAAVGAAAPLKRYVSGGPQTIPECRGLLAHQEHNSILWAACHGVRPDGHDRSGLATWGSPQPSLLRRTWKNSWSLRRTKRTGWSLRRISTRSSGHT
ncbi:MAG: Uncharacterised protein [Cyanobium sp. ARS6]|nr:MAG: Uncharacterised protein [Cyanobium sp. ARS6]